MAFAIRRSSFAASATQLFLPCLVGGIAIVGCSDDSNPAPVTTAGSAGSGGTAGSAGAAGASVGGDGGAAGSSMATAGAAGATVAVVEPFDPVVLFPFDFVAAGTYDWFVDPAPSGVLSVVDADRDAANVTPGALRFTAAFAPYDAFGASPPVTAIYQFGDATTGTSRALQGAARVHFWIRQVNPVGLASSLNFFQPFIQGGTATGFSNNFGYATADALADNQWHEFTLEVAGSAFMLDVWRVGVAIAPPAEPIGGALGPDAGDGGPVDAGGDGGADAGGNAPAPVTIEIDYVWVE